VLAPFPFSPVGLAGSEPKTTRPCFFLFLDPEPKACRSPFISFVLVRGVEAPFFLLWSHNSLLCLFRLSLRVGIVPCSNVGPNPRFLFLRIVAIRRSFLVSPPFWFRGDLAPFRTRSFVVSCSLYSFLTRRLFPPLCLFKLNVSFWRATPGSMIPAPPLTS